MNGSTKIPEMKNGVDGHIRETERGVNFCKLKILKLFNYYHSPYIFLSTRQLFGHSNSSAWSSTLFKSIHSAHGKESFAFVA